MALKPYFCVCISPSDVWFCSWSFRAAEWRQTATGLIAKNEFNFKVSSVAVAPNGARIGIKKMLNCRIEM